MKRLAILNLVAALNADAAVLQHTQRTVTTKGLTADIELWSESGGALLEGPEDVPGCLARHPKIGFPFLRH